MVVMLPASCDPGYAELGVQVGQPVMTQQAKLFGFSVDGEKNPFIPNLDIPNVIPSTFSNLPANASRSSARAPSGSSTTRPPRCRTPWWRPGSPMVGSS